LVDALRVRRSGITMGSGVVPQQAFERGLQERSPKKEAPMSPRKMTPPPTRRERPAPRGIRLVVADSQALDRGGMVGLLENERDFEVAGEAATVEETIAQCRALKPDVLVLSLNLPDQDRAPAIPAIRTVLPQLRILALSERGA